MPSTGTDTPNRRRTRKILVLAVAVPLAALVLYPLLRRTTLPEQAVATAPYVWANPSRIVEPPWSALTGETLEDPVLRAVHRLTWGTPDLVYWTQQHLPQDHDRLARRLIEELQDVVVGAPLAARQLVTTLGILGLPECVDPLLALAQRDPDFLQVVAIQALARCPWNERVEQVLASLSRHPNPQVRDAARRAILNQPGFWDQQAISEFLAVEEGNDVNVVVDEVGNLGLPGLADDVARHLDSPSLRTRQIAIRTLLRLGDARGRVAAEAELASGDDRRVGEALLLYRDAGVLPPLAAVERLADHPSANLRTTLATTLGPHDGETPEEAERAIALLKRLGDTRDEAVRQAAIQKLYARGSFEQLEPYRESLRESRGESLKEAVRFLCEVLKDPSAAPLIRERLARTADPTDVANLLFGLRFVGSAADAPLFLEHVRKAGTAEDRRGGTQTYLSEHAGLYLQTLGEAVEPALLEAFPRAPTVRARLLLLDALRGVVAAGSTAATEFLFAVIEDPDQDVEVRLAAAESLPFLDDAGISARVLEAARACEDREVADRLLRVFACYF